MKHLLFFLAIVSSVTFSFSQSEKEQPNRLKLTYGQFSYARNFSGFTLRAGANFLNEKGWGFSAYHSYSEFPAKNLPENYTGEYCLVWCGVSQFDVLNSTTFSITREWPLIDKKLATSINFGLSFNIYQEREYVVNESREWGSFLGYPVYTEPSHESSYEPSFPSPGLDFAWRTRYNFSKRFGLTTEVTGQLCARPNFSLGLGLTYGIIR